MAHELNCPVVAPWFDSCRLVCLNDPNALCGNPGDQCPILPETTTPGILPETTTTPSGVPTAPSKKIFNLKRINFIHENFSNPTNGTHNKSIKK